MIGYEARARITADVAGFVAGQRQAAQAANALSTAVQTLNTQLMRTHNLSAQAAAGMRSIGNIANTTSQSQRNAANSTQTLNNALEQGAQAYNAANAGAQQGAQTMANNAAQTNNATQATQQNTQANRQSSQSLTSMGQQMEKLSNQRKVLTEQQRNQGRLNQQETQALATLRERLRELGQRYSRLSDEQKLTVDSARAMAAAQNTVRSSVATMTREIRESVREQERGKQAAQQSAQSLRSMGTELAKLIPQQQRFHTLQAQGVQLSREQAQSAAAVDTRLGQLTQQYMRLDAASRRTVNSHRDLAMSQRLTTQATEQQSAAQVRLNQVGSLTYTQLQQLGRQLEQTSQDYLTLNRVQASGAQVTQGAANSHRHLRTTLMDLRSTYNQLDAAQRGVVDQMRASVRASNDTAAAKRRLATEAREAAAAQRQLQQALNGTTGAMGQTDQAARGINGSMWAMRSAVGDATSSMSQLWSVAQRSTRALWENYSAQEMAIAQISRVSQATVSELDSIVQQVRTMSTEIPIAFEELGEIAMLGSQVGIANEALGTFTETVALFAATSEVSADETATMLARIMEMTKLSQTHGQESVRNLGSAIAYLGSNALATDREILKTVESIATMTTQVGFSAEATVGLGSAMASLVIRPEIARGASQRVFLQLGEAINTTGSEMETLVEVTGRTQAELQEMASSNFEQYFFTVMEALGGVAEEGRDLIPIIREMGIINTRDAEVVARLAANYGILEQSVSESAHAFESGQYLYEESDRIFQTLTARVQIMSNTWSNFMFSAVEAIAPFLTRLVDATTNLIAMADAMGAAPFLGGAALFLGIAGAIGLLVSGLGFAAQGVLSFIGVINLLRGRTAANTAVTLTAAGANTTLAGSAVAAGAATAGQAGAATAGAAANRGLAASLAVATGAMRAFVLSNPVLAVIALGAALLGAVAAWDAFSGGADRANERLLRANQTHIDAAGGMKALQDALITDTERWNEAREAAEAHRVTLNDGRTVYQESAQDILRYSAFRTESSRDMVAADKEAAEAAKELEEAQSDAAFGIVSSSGEAGTATEQLSRRYQDSMHPMLDATGDLNYAQQQLQDTVDDTASSFDGATYAIGVATRDWGAAVLNSAMIATDMWESAEALKLVNEAGVNFSSALTMELREAGAGTEYLRDGITQMTQDMGYWETEWMKFSREVNRWTGGLIDFRNETGVAVDGMWDMVSATGSVSAAIEASDLTKGQSITLLSEMAEELGYTTDELMDMDDAQIEAAASAEVLNEAVMGTGLTVGEFAEAMASFIDPLDAWRTGLEDLNAGLEEGEEAYERFIDKTQDRNDFNEYLAGMYDMREAQLEWSTNLLELSETVPPQVIGDLAAMGVEGAGLVADLVDATDEQVDRWVDLWEQGGADLLTDYAVIWESFRVQAFEGGDAGGLAFVNELMGKVAIGDLKMSEAVDQMIDYAEENFENADPTMDFYAENTEAINTLNDTLTEVRDAIRDMERDGDSTLEIEADGSKVTTWWNNFKQWWSGLNNLSLNIGVNQVSGSGTGQADGGWAGEGRADGGWVRGPGGPRQDKVGPVWLSPDEFVVRAAVAQRNASFLEMLNERGHLPSARGFMPEADHANYLSRSPSSVSRTPDYGQTASAGVRRQSASEKIVMNIRNYYPQAEPTSVTTNRALQHAAGLNGVL